MRRILLLPVALLAAGLLHVPAAAASPACVTHLGGNCGAYFYPAIPMSNGFDTYVSDQPVGPQPGTAETLTAHNPGDWKVAANDVPYGYTGVQTGPSVQQLTNDWNGHGWGGTSGTRDTPVAHLSALRVNYRETSPAGTLNIYEGAADIWTNTAGQLGPGSGDIMFWTDTHGRCNPGAFGGTNLGHAYLDGRLWTVHRYGPRGAEIIFILADSRGFCARQPAGSVNILAGLRWLNAHHVTSPAISTIQMMTFGWEITSAQHATFTMSGFSITAKAA